MIMNAHYQSRPIRKNVITLFNMWVDSELNNMLWPMKSSHWVMHDIHATQFTVYP